VMARTAGAVEIRRMGKKRCATERAIAMARRGGRAETVCVCVCVSPPLWSVVPGDGDERKGTTRTGLYTCYLASLLELQAVKLGRFSPWSMTCSPPGMHAWLAAAIGE
jgi:hypothetical protein